MMSPTDLIFAGIFTWGFGFLLVGSISALGGEESLEMFLDTYPIIGSIRKYKRNRK